MWSDLTTVEDTIACTPPYSFYFDLIGSYWKAEAANNLPLHRLCTLARKQGASFVVVESAIHRAEVRADVDALDESLGGGGAADAVAISFFRLQEPPVDVSAVPEGAFLGQAIVINYRAPGETAFTHSYVFEGVLRTPTLPGDGGIRRPLLNNYISYESEFDCTVRGRTFTISGVYYCQQNRVCHVCAHAALRMAITTRSNRSVTASYINSLLNAKTPDQGLNIGQVVKVIEDQGLKASVFDCTNLSAETYTSALAAILESGGRALLVFTTGIGTAHSSQEHVVLAYGHTRNSDEWHPQAISAYAGPSSAKYYPASNWIDHFLIHDDNFGPYYTLSSQALEFDPKVKAHWIIAVWDAEVVLAPHGAETLAASLLSNLMQSLAPLSSGRWFDYLTKRSWTYVLRTVLVSREEYLQHLASVAGHDGTKMTAADLQLLSGLPNRFWMVEFTLPALLTGNRSKLGEMLIATNTDPNPIELFLALRIPKQLVLKNGSSPAGVPHDVGLDSHVPAFRRNGHDHEW